MDAEQSKSVQIIEVLSVFVVCTMEVERFGSVILRNPESHKNSNRTAGSGKG
jgi:hypothetical protein